MILNNKDVTTYLNEKTNRIVHVFGEPDAGKTRSMFFLINEMNKLGKICAYVHPGVQFFQYEAFKKFIEYPDQTPVLQAENLKDFSSQVRALALYIDIFIVDGFLTYIIHQKITYIQKVFQEISAIAFKYNINFMLVNEMRFNKEKDMLVPAYDQFFRHFCQSHILITKDENYNISFGFKTI